MKINLILIIFVFITMLFVDVFSHELYHYYANKENSKGIYFDSNELTAYTLIEFQNYKEKLNYNDEIKNKEEFNADVFGKISSLVYLTIIFIILKK